LRIDELGHKAWDIYQDAVNSGDDDVIRAAIADLRQIEDDITLMVVQLGEIAERHEDDPELYDYIRQAIAGGEEQLEKIDTYIAELDGLLRVISIELSVDNLDFHMKLGTSSTRMFDLANTGKLPVGVDAGYVDINGDGVIDKYDLGGLSTEYPTGKDTFATMINDLMLPGGNVRRVIVLDVLPVGEVKDMQCAYYSPTELSAEFLQNGHGFSVEFRAWETIVQE